MGKKPKVGKARRDKFYHLAKETGFRARSAFKLLQLNRKYEFLQQSRVCIDLCAAPGGWLQVAAQNMPISSLIIGIDLMPIKPINKVTTFQEDITSEKCRQILRKELQTWEADVFLNDGAPNVGSTWVHDAFMQAELTLHALKLATEFLRKGGWFVTKVFRSKDYQSLMWVFQQLFKKVYATKPQASRNESAEIFVVCQHFVKPDHIDAKFLDPKFVFKDVESEQKNVISQIYATKEKKKAPLGYEDGATSLHKQLKVTEFLSAENNLELLAEANEVVFDDKELEENPLTTTEIKECFKDIKVLGKKEIRSLLNWRKKIKAQLEPKDKPEEEESTNKVEEVESDDEEKLEQKIADLQEDEVKDNKKKRKKVMKEKRKLRDKMNLKMVIPGDKMEIGDDLELFNLKKIKKKHELKEVSKEEMESGSEEEDSDDDGVVKKKTVDYDRYANETVDETISDDDAESVEESDAEQEDMEHQTDDDQDDDSEEDNDDEEKQKENGSANPLVVDLEPSDVRAQHKTDMWFKKAAFSGLEGEDDEDLEIEKMSQAYKRKGGVVLDKKSNTKEGPSKKRKLETESDEKDSGHDSEVDNEDNESEHADSESSDDSDSDNESDSDSDSSSSDSDYDIQKSMKKTKKNDDENKKMVGGKHGFEIVSQHESASKIVKLNPEELALGEEMIKSSKRKREIIEDSYNRYTFNDDNLPDWFAKDERRHMRKPLPVTKDQIEAYKLRMKAINAAPIKKIAEAKARKKRKAMKKLEKARKKADAVTENNETTESEKWNQIKQIYKKAGVLGKKKPETTYVVAKKGVGRRVSRPAGVKGRFKVVDPRLKKDLKNQKLRDKKSKKAGGKKNASKGRRARQASKKQ